MTWPAPRGDRIDPITLMVENRRHFERTGVDLVERERLERSLVDFVRSAWPVVEPAQPYQHNWHIDLIAEYLEAVTAGELRRLIICIPPRFMKSRLVSVFWPAWEWTTRPGTRSLFVSYSGNLSTQHSLDRRAIISGEWYQKRWGDRVALADDQNLKTEFHNTRRGQMIATSVGGTVLGRGGDRVVIDDPQSPQEAFSDVERENTLRFYRDNLSSRLNNPKSGAFVLIMQRLHEEDLAGYLSGFDFTMVALEQEAEERTVIRFPRSGRELTREAGDLLWPERMGREEVEAAKLMGEITFAAQQQQKPVPSRGGTFKRDWWRFYANAERETIRQFARRPIAFCDTAQKKGRDNDYTVFAVWAVMPEERPYPPGYYLLDLYRGKEEFPEQVEVALRMHQRWRCRRWVIEDASSGSSLAQYLQRKRLPTELYAVDQDKKARAHAVSGYVQAGLCWLPNEADWLYEFLRELGRFPAVKHDDQTDTLTMMLSYHELDPPDESAPGVLHTRRTKGWGG